MVFCGSEELFGDVGLPGDTGHGVEFVACQVPALEDDLKVIPGRGIRAKAFVAIEEPSGVDDVPAARCGDLQEVVDDGPVLVMQRVGGDEHSALG
jgi:hypothetical protein